MSHFSSSRERTVCLAKVTLAFIVTRSNNADKRALEYAGHAMECASRWIDVPTEALRSRIRENARVVLESTKDSHIAANIALEAFAMALLAYADCYYGNANKALAIATKRA